MQDQANEVRPSWARYFPRDNNRSAQLIAAFSGLVSLGMVILAVRGIGDYGLALFCGVPIALGVFAPLLHGLGAPRTFGQMFAVSVLAQFVLFLSMLFLGVEGIICLLMAAPLWFVCGLVGTAIAWPVHRLFWKNHINARGFPIAGLLIFLSLPLWMGAEHANRGEPQTLVLTTTIDIDAPPEVVWNNVIAFPDIPAPGWNHGGWLFHLGIAHPLRAEIEDTGLAATRYCVFSTGRAVEPVRIWQPGRLLEVDVIQTPPSMDETSIYPHLHPPHLQGTLESVRARFELVELRDANGHLHTRLIGTSFYRNHMFPAAYWQLWSDAAIKAVQVHVLDHIKNLSEQKNR